MSSENLNAEVIAVFPNKVKITVDKLEDFKIAGESLKVGSYLRISDNEDSKLFAIIENFSIQVDDEGKRRYLIEANPVGIIQAGKFERGGDSIAIPPKKVEPATESEITTIYSDSIKTGEKFEFSSLAGKSNIRIPVNGNKFFNKHVAVIGSTGSGKSHTVATIINKAISEKTDGFRLNNSHIVIFDIHSEYKAAFPSANHLGIENLLLPYWLLNSEELEEIFLDTGERDNYNQASVFRLLVTENKKKYNPQHEKVFYDSPLYFDISEIQNALNNMRTETVNYKNNRRYMIVDPSYSITDGKTDDNSGLLLSDKEKITKYFENELIFHPLKGSNITKGDYADGTLDKFTIRLMAKVSQERLSFLFGHSAKTASFESTLNTLLGYEPASNITVIDLSGIPFEVLSITVSLISRLLFDYGYYYKRLRCKKNKDEKINNDIPILLVYEEAHKYVPTSDLLKYRASKKSIERIAKEGRKYGVTLLLASQRPSEISETIFSQCNNFIAMRLTNPSDLNYVKKLLPDTMGNLIEMMPSLRVGEALLVGESIVLPSIVEIDKCINPPSSQDIPYWQLWKEKWRDLDIDGITEEWLN